MHRDSFDHSGMSFNEIDFVLKTQCKPYFSYSLSPFLFSVLPFGCCKLRNKLIARAFWMMNICSFHLHVYSSFYLGHYIDLHKTKNPSNFEGYIRRIFLPCGDEGIRTLDRVTPIHTFQACSFDHSDTSPFWIANVRAKSFTPISSPSPYSCFPLLRIVYAQNFVCGTNPGPVMHSQNLCTGVLFCDSHRQPTQQLPMDEH